MNATVIDTLRLADRLKEAGFEAPRAEGMARALGDELAERMLTKRDLDEAKRDIDARFAAVDAKFDAMDTKFDTKFDAMDAKFDAMHARFDAMDAKFDAMNETIKSVQRESSGKINVLIAAVALCFTMLAGLVTHAVVAHFSGSPGEVPPVAGQGTERAITGSRIGHGPPAT